ncbi:MAG: hypothetical protein SGILL_002074 [Bacillariaceae sp.]
MEEAAGESLTAADDGEQLIPLSLSPSSTLPSTSDTATLTALSKTQRKKLQKKERQWQLKQEKKQREKEERHARAIAAGRDLEAERAFQHERTLVGDRQRRLQQVWQEKIQHTAAHQFQICIDCAFESMMREREIASLAQQLRYCYAYNKKSPHPSLVAVTSLVQGSVTRELLEKEAGFSTWHQRAFACTEQSLKEYYHMDSVDALECHNTEATVTTTSSIAKTVYLTSDSENVLDYLEDDTVYIIGGIVDRNRLKGVAMKRANDLGVATAKLPLDDYLSQMPSTRVLTCNHVFDILLKYREYGNDWSKALQAVLPSRKGAEIQQRKAAKGRDENNKT